MRLNDTQMFLVYHILMGQACLNIVRGWDV